MNSSDLHGTWTLKSWTLTDATGEVEHPFGDSPVGFLTYTADGRMSAHISKVDRKPFQSDKVFEPLPHETNEDYFTNVSYCGAFDLVNDEVQVHVEISTFPNWIGRTLVRDCQIIGSRLSLSCHRDEKQSVWEWERMT